MIENIDADIVIAGGGSAGFGAALYSCLLSKGNHKVVMIDSNPSPGGTSVHAGVNCWGMGIGGERLAKRLLPMKGKAAVLKGNWKPLTRQRPYAIARPAYEYTYRDTLKAAAVYDRMGNHNSFVFEPDAIAFAMESFLREARVHLLTGLQQSHAVFPEL